MGLRPRRFGQGDPDVLIDINTTPLIDVLLVLLVMLIITIPIQLHAVNLQLPVAAPPETPATPPKVQIDIDEKSLVHWQGVRVMPEELEDKMMVAGQQTVRPEIHLRPHKDSQYRVFAAVLSATRRHGLDKVAVIGSEQFAQ